MISMYQLIITIKILATYLPDTSFSYSRSWRWMLGALLHLGVMQSLRAKLAQAVEYSDCTFSYRYGCQ